MTSRTLTWAVAAFAATASVVCVLNGATADAPDLNIHATGQWSNGKETGDWRADLALDGNTVSGVVDMTGQPEIQRAPVSGSVSGDSFALRVGGSRAVATMSGSFSATALVGAYRTRGGDSGTWVGSWRADPPRIVSQWPAGPGLEPPIPSAPDMTPQLSSIMQLPPPALRTAPTADAPISPQAATAGTNVLVNNPAPPTPGFGIAQNEPEIAMDRASSKVAAGANDSSFATDVRPGYYYSPDGGATWTVHGQIPGLGDFGLGQLDAGGDPVLDFDAAGRVHYAGVAFDRGPPGTQCLFDSTVFVARSLDGGYSINPRGRSPSR